jgi:hypothetical protein
MKIGKIVELEDAATWSPVCKGVEYTDRSGARVFIPESLIVRLYEGLRYHYKNSDQSWESRCNRIFSKQERGEQ